MSTVIRLLVYCRADCYPRGLFDSVLNMCCPCCVFRSRRSHQRSQDFCWGGAPGRRQPALHQSCTSVKLSRAAGDMWALHHSAESWVEPQNEIKMAQNYRWNDIWGRVFVNAIQSSLQKDTFTIQWLAVNPSSDNFYTDAVGPSSDQYCIEPVAPSGDHCCIDIVVPSSDHYGTTKVAPP